MPLLAAVTADRPDVAIVDVRLPPTFTDEGLRAALAARREAPGLPVLVLSQYVEQLYARELLAGGAGGIGYLLKDRVLDGAQFVGRGAPGRGGRHRDGPGGDRPAAGPQLRRTARWPRSARASARCSGLMAEGRSNAAIAQRLVITERAVAKHTAPSSCGWACSPPTTTTGGCSPSWRSSTGDQPAGYDREAAWP